MIQTCILKITLATIWKRDKKRREEIKMDQYNGYHQNSRKKR